jgi:hypothetical protein
VEPQVLRELSPGCWEQVIRLSPNLVSHKL